MLIDLYSIMKTSLAPLYMIKVAWMIGIAFQHGAILKSFVVIVASQIVPIVSDFDGHSDHDV